MLGKKKATRTQMATGSMAIVALAIGGLAFTASGTQAAERVRAGMEDATGIEMTMPEMPEMPETPETPETPDVPAEPGTRHIAVQQQKGRDTVVTVTTDGRTTTYTGADADRYIAARPAPIPPVPPMPPVPSVAPVPPVPPMPPVPPVDVDVADLNAQAAELGRNAARLASVDAARLQRQAAYMQRNAARDSARLQRQAAAMAREAARIDTAQLRRQSVEIERQSFRAALTGLEHARAGLTVNRNLTESQRAEALAAVDRELAKLRRRVEDRD